MTCKQVLLSDFNINKFEMKEFYGIRICHSRFYHKKYNKVNMLSVIILYEST